MDDYLLIGEDGSITFGLENPEEFARLNGGVLVPRDEYIAPPYVPSPQELAATESSWRETEMPRAQQNVTAIEYGEEGIPGTAQQWQKYWLALRKWADTNPDFPDSSKRPVAPT